MLYLLEQFWVFCLLALILGVVVSYLTRGEKVGRGFWFNCLLVLGLIGLIAAVLMWFKGRSGLGLEVALLSLASYLIGCCIPCLLGLCADKPAAKVEAPVIKAAVAPAVKIATPAVAPVAAAAIPSVAAAIPSVAAAIPSVAAAIPEVKAAVETKMAEVKAAVAPVAAAVAPVAAAVAPVAAAVAPVAAAVNTHVSANVTSPKGHDIAEMPKVEGEDLIAGKRPLGLYQARNNKADDLKRIKGIGPQNEGRLHGLGVWHFDQISQWTKDNVEWVGTYLAFPGRIDREDWIGQSKILAAGGITEFASRVDKGEVATSLDDGSKGAHNVAHMRVDGFDGTRPKGIPAARNGKADDLKLLNGVGRVIEEKLHALGVFHFDQVASMTESELKFVSDFVGFPNRAIRENWAGEAKILAAGGETDFSKAVKAGKVPTSL